MTAKNIQLNNKNLLFQLATVKSSGCLCFDAKLVSWKIYLQQGNLKYVYCSAQLLNELKYYLHYLGFKQAVVACKNLPHQVLYSEVICWLIEEKYLAPSQSLQLIEHITKDALRSCLWSDRVTTSWHEGQFLSPWIIDSIPSLSVWEFLRLEETRLEQWQNCTNQLYSVHQRPYFAHDWEQQPLPTSGILKDKNLKQLTQIIKGDISLRQLSLFLQKDELNVAKILSPYIDDGIIKLRKPQSPLDLLPNIPRFQTSVQPTPLLVPSNNSKSNDEHNPLKTATSKIWKIVCIDDSPTILQEIQRFLGKNKFKVTAIDDPVQAVAVIFRIKPDLILLDITMPRINGYKLCELLKGSDYCSGTPIIMVTANTGLIDRAKARIAGADDYLTKPFTSEGLAKIVAKHIL